MPESKPMAKKNLTPPALQQFQPLFEKIEELVAYEDMVLLAIDGNSAAGKTTLASKLVGTYQANLFHMDDFFLPTKRKTPERLAEPGGNVDYERFYNEVLTNVLRGKGFSYRPFNCSRQELGQPIAIQPRRLNIIEGAYSLHPTLAPHYHLKVFLAIDPNEQSRRILERNGAQMHKRFMDQWVPLENAYFRELKIQQQSDLVFWLD